MKLFVTVKPNAKLNFVEKIDDLHFRISVKAPPQDGKANQAVVKMLSEYFDAPKSRFLLLHGESSKAKAVRFNEEENE